MLRVSLERLLSAHFTLLSKLRCNRLQHLCRFSLKMRRVLGSNQLLSLNLSTIQQTPAEVNTPQDMFIVHMACFLEA